MQNCVSHFFRIRYIFFVVIIKLLFEMHFAHKEQKTKFYIVLISLFVLFTKWNTEKKNQSLLKPIYEIFTVLNCRFVADFL